MTLLATTMRRTVWLVLGLAHLVFRSAGQSFTFTCGTDLLPPPATASANQSAKGQLKDDPTKGYTIPIVFIIYHLGESIGQGSNVSDADIQRQIDLLNERYSGLGYAGYQGQDSNIRFTLARRTPDCQSTNGIYRVDGRSVPGYEAEGVSLYDGRAFLLSRLAPVDFSKTTAQNGVILISIYHRLRGVGGFATYFGQVATQAQTYSQHEQSINYVLSHEVGHVLSLRHTFEGSVESPTGSGQFTCPSNANPLTDGDMVADTDPVRYADNPPNACVPGSGYESYINPCSGLPFGKISNNIMHYGCQQDRFTPGQVAKIRTALANELKVMQDSPYLYPPKPSEVVAPLSCALTQLQPPASSFTSVGINYLHFQDIDQQSGAYPAGQYSNNSCNTYTQVTAGQSYQLTVNGYGTYGRAYLDFNNDGHFDESSEQIMTFQSGDRNQEYSASQLVTIPSTAIVNQRLRLRIIFDSGTTPPTACNLPGDPAIGSGEVEDYGVTVVTPLCLTVRSGPWNDPTLWSCGRLPTALDAVTIQPDHTILLDSTMVEAVCRNLEILGTFSMQGSSIAIDGNRLVIDESNVVTK